MNFSNDPKKLKQQVVAGGHPASNLFRIRINICNTCPKLIKTTRMCSKCFCFVDLKTKMIEQSCPEEKW
jgi:hypothetical protein